MSAVSLPVTRPIGRALVVAGASSRVQPVGVLQRIGYSCAEADDPYTAMAELCHKPLVYRAVILSLTSLYREELPLVAAVKGRFPHIEIWLTQTDGRQASLAEAMRLGADGLLSDDGLHRIAFSANETTIKPAESPRLADEPDDEPGVNEPILTADELRALLQEQPGRE